jgi:hypothetical protein
MKSLTFSFCMMIALSITGLSTLAVASNLAHKRTESTVSTQANAHTVNAIYQHMLLHPLQ